MRKLTFGLLWVFVFSMPWEQFITLPFVGSLSRLLGLVLVGIGLLLTIVERRLRRPGVVFWLAAAFAMTAQLSLLWTISYERTLPQVITYCQLMGLVVVVWEFARRREQQESLLVAYVVGAYVSIVDSFRNFAIGSEAWRGAAEGRYAATGFDPNDLCLMLAIGVPMAWYLFLIRRGFTRFVGALYLPLAGLCVPLAASRAGLLSYLLSMSILPLTMGRRSLRAWGTAIVLLLAVAGVAAMIVPQKSWQRLLTVGEQLSEGSVGGRAIIWEAGLQVSQERILLGAGAGAFRTAVHPLVGSVASHNVLIAVLVEQGLAGLLIFISIIAACAWIVYGMPSLERKVWAIIGCTWLTGSMSLDWQDSKATWLLFALVSGVGALKQARRSRDCDVSEDGIMGAVRSSAGVRGSVHGDPVTAILPLRPRDSNRRAIPFASELR